MLDPIESSRLVADIDAQTDDDRDRMVGGFQHACAPGARVRGNLTPQELRAHVEILGAGTDEDWDDYLQDLFCVPWPTKESQDN